MRWDNLFADLESQLERELTADEVDLEAEEERLRLGRLGLRDRIVAMQDAAASADRELALQLPGHNRLTVRPAAIGRDWLSADIVGEQAGRAQCVVPFAAIVAISLAPRQVRESLTVVPASALPSLSERLGLAFVLRDLCRRRRPLEFEVGGSVFHGTIDRVGRDHFDVAVHENGTPRRASAVTECRVVPFDRLELVRL